MGKKKGKEPEPPPKDEFDPVSLVSKKAQTVVLMLDSPEEAVLQSACEALYKFAEKCDENKQLLLNLGALDLLLKLMVYEDKLVKRNATMAIGTLATDANVRKILRKSDCLASIMALLGPEEDVLCHEFGSLALASLAEEFTSKVDIFEQGGLEPLINLLSSHDCDVQKNSVQAIALLLQDYQSRAAFHELNGIEPILKLTDSEYPVIQELALTALVRCTLDADNRTAFRDINGLDKLVDMIGKKELEDLHVLCLQVLANCLADSENLQAMQSTGVFDKLLAFIAESTNPEVQRYAAMVIAGCCKNSENRKLFHEQETEKTLITLLSGENVEVSVAAAKALAVLSENLNSRDVIGKLDGIQPLLGLLKNESVEMRETATYALANLSSGNINNCTEIVEKGGIDMYVKLLYDAKPSVLGNISVCLTNLAHDESWRADMLKAGVINGLTSAMQSNDSDVQNKSCQALSALICDADARNELYNEGGLQYLINLLKSNNDSVRRSASWALTMCCVDHSISSEVTKLGGLAILQELNLSSTRKSPFTEAALERVLDSNLSAKYALTGVLKPDNIIADGFYDAGRFTEGAEFPCLETLCNMPVDQKRPVLLINSYNQSHSKSKSLDPVPRIEVQATTPQQQAGLRPNKSKADARTKSRAKDEKAPQADEAASAKENSPTMQRAQHGEKRGSGQWQPPDDPVFASYVVECKENISNLLTTREQIEALAKFVSDNMGGAVPADEVGCFSFELPISQLKYASNTNVLTIGQVKTGIFYHRALLFKALADRIGVSCSLTRGDYGRAWNEVRLCDKEETSGRRMPPKTYVVDLMHDPGECYLSSSPQAVAYQRI
eukprot:gene4774-5401_t